MSLAVSVIGDDAALQALAPEWEALWREDPVAGVFQSPDWLLPWRAHLGAGPGLRTLAARRGDGRLVGLLPLFLYASEGGRQLTLLGNGVSDTLDLIAAPEARAEVVRALAAHLATAGDWDTADLRDLPAGSALLGLGGAAQPETPRPVLALQPPEALAARFEPKLVRDLRQARRRAEAAGPVVIRAADAASAEADLDALFRLHAARWEGRGEPGVLADAAVQAFHREIARRFVARGWLRLYVVSVGAETAGVHYGFTAKACAYFYLGGFDARFERLSPGGLLLEHALAEAAEGARTADFLRGQEAYKYRWGAVDEPQVRLRLRRG